MTDATILADDMAAKKEAVTKTVQKEQRRLFNFIKKRVDKEEDAEDILQDVFYQFVSNLDFVETIEQKAAWLFRVARNKVIDWYRKQKPESLDQPHTGGTALAEEDGAPLYLEDVLFDERQSPDELYARSVVWKELSHALEDLPEEQRDVFVMHELEGIPFKEIADITGESVNTLLSRKRYAILFLRKRLRDIYNDLLND